MQRWEARAQRWKARAAERRSKRRPVNAFGAGDEVGRLSSQGNDNKEDAGAAEAPEATVANGEPRHGPEMAA